MHTDHLRKKGQEIEGRAAQALRPKIHRGLTHINASIVVACSVDFPLLGFKPPSSDGDWLEP
jgi:hypothetical protein